MPNYDEIVARMKAEGEDCFPFIKVRISWPDGGGESVWAHDLGHGLALMSNEPLYPKYRFHDIFRFSGRNPGDVAYRPFPVKMLYRYEPLNGDVDKLRRGLLHDSLGGLRVRPGFFCMGQGYVLLREGAEPSEVKAALVGTGVPVSEVVVQEFDVKTDKYTYLDVP